MGEHRVRDVVVIGGGAAGLAGATALTRFRRDVLVIDAGTPRNAPAAAVHNYLGREGTPPLELLEIARAELAGYGGTVLAASVVTVRRSQEDGSFRVVLNGGSDVFARRVLVATGLADELPGVPGLASRWGRDVLHCPYCHGYEARDQRIAVLATGPSAVHQAQLFRQLTDQVTLLQHTAPAFDADDAARLAARGIDVVEGTVEALEIVDDRLVGVRLRGGAVVACDDLVVSPQFRARGEVLADLGLTPVPVEMNGHVIGTALPAEPGGATAVPGLYVAGNVADLRAHVLTSAAAGLATAAMLNADLISEEVEAALIARVVV